MIELLAWSAARQVISDDRREQEGAVEMLEFSLGRMKIKF